jgi:hypothetical protein
MPYWQAYIHPNCKQLHERKSLVNQQLHVTAECSRCGFSFQRLHTLESWGKKTRPQLFDLSFHSPSRLPQALSCSTENCKPSPHDSCPSSTDPKQHQCHLEHNSVAKALNYASACLIENDYVQRSCKPCVKTPACASTAWFLVLPLKRLMHSHFPKPLTPCCGCQKYIPQKECRCLPAIAHTPPFLGYSPMQQIWQEVVPGASRHRLPHFQHCTQQSSCLLCCRRRNFHQTWQIVAEQGLLHHFHSPLQPANVEPTPHAARCRQGICVCLFTHGYLGHAFADHNAYPSCPRAMLKEKVVRSEKSVELQ